MPDAPPNPVNGQNNKDKNIWQQIGRYSNLGMILPASVIAGIVIGALLDRWLKTKWITLAGLLLGCVVGFIELIRGAMRAGKES
jgi:F0F1-type ATP synthase assembly protein I